MGIFDILVNGFTEVLQLFHRFTNSYGVDIVLLTLAVRILLWPLTHSQVMSARRMQVLQPEIDKIRKKYKNDQVRMNQELMNLWKENKINPAAGCLPLLVQLPVLWALYQSIAKFEILKQASFLWIKSLGGADPYYIFPVLAGVTTFFQMKMTTPAGGYGDGGQQVQMQRMMLWMFPVLVVFMTVQLPSGIGIYWVVSNLITILQQKIVFAKPVAKGGNADA